MERNYPVTVCALPGTEKELEEAWRESLGSLPFKVRTVEAGTRYSEILEDVLADSDVPDGDVIVVPANCYPLGKLTLSDIDIPLVTLDRNGNPHYANLLPRPFNIERLMDFLPANDSLTEEEFMQRYVKTSGRRPLEVSFHFGNCLTPVMREDPCEHKVIEALVRKRFVVTNAAGWKALSGILARLKKG